MSVTRLQGPGAAATALRGTEPQPTAADTQPAARPEPAAFQDRFRTEPGAPAAARPTPEELQLQLFQARRARRPERVALPDLPAADQALVDGCLAARPQDGKLAEGVRALLEDASFQGLQPDVRTAVLSQVSHYPDSRSIHNVQRLIQKDWFHAYDLADKQRALKTIACMSQHDAGDQKIICNTLDHFLAPDAPFHLDFNSPSGAFGVAYRDKNLFSLRRDYIGDGNEPLDLQTNWKTREVCFHTFNHEVNHLLNEETEPMSFAGFMNEYRAFYVGNMARDGHPPTVKEMRDSVVLLLTRYPSMCNLHESARPPAERRPFPEGQGLPYKDYDGMKLELDKIVEFMKGFHGRQDVTHQNMDDLEPLQPDAPAPLPDGNIDNH